MSPFNKYPILKKILFFFPAQLVLVHVQRNFLIMFFWIFLTSMLMGWWGKGLGLHFLFLEPEYLGTSGFWAFFFTGLCFGGFVSAFNLSSYLINSHRFPFLATLRKPFFKYCINNFILPALFIILYIRELYAFKNTAENLGETEGFWIVLVGFLSGFFIFVLFLLGYFFAFNNDLKRLFGIDPEDIPPMKFKGKKKITPIKAFKFPKRLMTEVPHAKGPNVWQTATYLHHPFYIRNARNVDHYPKEILKAVFNRNHFNALLFQLIVVLVMFLLGIFREVPILQIPSAASILLVLTLFMMIAGAFQFLFGRWNIVIVVFLVFLLDFTVRHKWINFHNYAYGLDYTAQPVNYNVDSLGYIARQNPFHEADVDLHTQILDRRKRKLDKAYGRKKHPMIIVNVSGGGSKMALWAFNVLQHLDSITGGQFFDHVPLISGSSGGMIGAAYYREMYMRSMSDQRLNLYDDSLAKNMSKDILNPIAGAIALNDLFIRTGTFTYENKSYPKDRGWAFESALNKNTHGVLNKKLKEYAEPEADADIPVLIMAPSVVEDGRRMIISALPVSFLSEKKMPDNFSWHPKIEDIEFNRLFEAHGADNLTMTTALRMNATFPMVLPPVTLPTEPAISLFDAGIRDNYGDLVAMKYVFQLRNWFMQNASEIIFLQIGDELRSDHNRYKDRKTVIGLLDGFFAPFSGVAGNVTTVQLYNNESISTMLGAQFKGKFKHVEMDLNNFEKEEISISFHLTEAEKNRIMQSIHLPWNQNSAKKILQTISQK